MGKYNKSKSKDTVDLSKVLNTLVSTLSQNTAAIKTMAANSKSDSDKPKPKPEPKQEDSSNVKAAKAAKEEFERSQDSLELKEKLKQLADEGAETEINAAEVLNDLFEEKLKLAKDLDKIKAGTSDIDAKQLQIQIDNNDAAIEGLKTAVELQQTQEKNNKIFNKTLASSLEWVDNLTSVNKLGASFKKMYAKRVEEGLKVAGEKGKLFQAGMIASLATIALVAKGADFLGKRIMANADQAELLHDKFGGSEKSIQNLKSGLKELGSNTKIVGANQEDVNASFDVLQKEFGTAVINNQELIDGQILLTKKIGMSAEQASNFRGQSVLTGVSVKDNLATIELQTKEFNEMAGTSFSIHEVQQDVADVSMETLAAYKGQSKQLTVAVLQAKKLGMTLDQAADHTKHLLDFESSIHEEMEANVLTGKHINLNEARRLRLNGDSAGAMAETLKQVGSYEEFVNQDVLSQEAVAKAAGMTVEELMKTYKQQKINAVMNKRAYKDLTAADKQKLISQKLLTKEGIEQATKEEERATISAKMSKIGDNLLNIFDKVFEGPITAIVDGITAVIGFTDKLVKKMGELEKTNPLLGAIARIGSMVGLVAAVGGGLFLFFSKKFKKKKLDEDSKKANIEVAKNTDGTIKFHEAAAHGGSIYTHDIHSEKILQAIADKDFGGGGSGGDTASDLLTTATQSGKKKRGKGKGKGRGKGKGKTKTTKPPGKPGPKGSGLKGLLLGMGTDLLMQAVETGEMPDLADLGDEVQETIAANAPALATSAISAAAAGVAKTGAKPKVEAKPKAGAKPKAPGKPGGVSIKPSAPKTGGGFFGGLKKIGGYLSEKASGVKKFAGKALNALNPMTQLKKLLPKLFASKGLAKILSFIPYVGKIVSGAMNLYTVGSAASGAAKSGESEQAVGKAVVQALGSVGGSMLGGIAGSIVPGAGTIIGGLLGGWGGEAIAGLIADNVDVAPIGKAAIKLFGPDKPAEGVKPTAAPPEQKSMAVKDALIRPGQPPISFDKGDLIMAGTNLLGGGQTNSSTSKESSEVAALLKELIKKIDQPVKINIGGKAISELEKVITMNKTYNTIGSGYSG